MNEAMNKVIETDIKSLSTIDSWVVLLYHAYMVLKLGEFFFSVSDVGNFCAKEDI